MPSKTVTDVCENIERFPKQFVTNTVRPNFAKQFKKLYNHVITNDIKAETD